jgi:signal transduction histidine kinase/ActR/RegA family two-component response regulator
MKHLQTSSASSVANPGHSSRGSAAHAAATALAALPGEAAFQAVFDSSAEALLVIDSAGVIQRASQRARELLRLQDASIRRAGLKDVLPGSTAEQLARWHGPPEAVPQSMDASLASGFPIRVTLRAVLPGTQQLLVCLEVGSVVERAEVKGRQAEAELRAVLDSVDVAIILFDPSGRVRFSSVRFGQLFGIEERQLEKITQYEEFRELVAERFRDPEAFAAPWKPFVQGGGEPGHDELEILRPARRVIERFSRPVLDAQKQPVGWLELYSDVTGERRLQSKMLRTEKMAALGQLVSGIAHELNNPLTSIMGYAQLLLGHGLAPAQLAEARKVYQEAERARRIVKNLLYFARRHKPERTRVDVNEIVERTLALRSYELKLENIAVECDLAQALPQTMADPYQLQQVILNLVVNAEQALLEERGQGHVWIRTSRRVLGAPYGPGDRLLSEVSDDGPGIPFGITSRIFDPFFTTKLPGVGTGLGLSIVYGIVHAHGGEVTFESQPGTGTKFVVELPVVVLPATEASAASSPQPARRAGTPRPGRILVVEDEPTVAQLMLDALREEGHQVEAVLDSQDGLTKLSRGRYDLVICDLRMPRLDGAAFYEALVGAGSPTRHRILFIMGDTLGARTVEFLESKRLPYLAKPFLVEELKLSVDHLLDLTGTQADAKARS